jgi:arabinofuranan 3-O-arabinosyltransferase
MLPDRSEPMSVAPLSPPPSATPPPHRLWARARRLDPVMFVATVVLAAATYVPSFMTKPGLVADDSKQYLYLDPGKLIQSAMSMWNPDVGMGTVTHQNIGFLFPMGPYYWIVQELHIPMWVGQRFWMGSLFFFAGAGIFFLGKLLGLSPWGRIAAGAAYTFTPFVIDYIARISAIVMPWAALGWMVGLVILSVRRGGWRYPALFAIVIALVGGVNATSILLAGLAPAFWIVNAVWVTKEVTYRQALAAVIRIGILSVVVSLWWVAGLWAEGVYGLNILRFTETIPTVTSTSSSSEVIRGLGYWYFYGQDKVQPWTSAAIPYMQNTWLIGVGFAVPTVCVAVGALARWRYRAFAVGLLFMGIVAAVAAYPLAHPSPFGKALRAAGSGSTIGLAMRSTNRVVPLVVLGLALLLGSGVSALAASHFKTGLFVLVVAVALAAADLPPLWTGNLVANNLARPEQLPSYVKKTATYLNTHGTGRVLGIPGEDFAYYRWGVTGDPVWVGLLTRPYVARQVVPQGEPSSVDLLQALDESIQDGVFVPSTLAPIARLMSAGDILFESDEQYERYNTARPQPLWLQLIDPTTGIGSPVSFGKPQLYKTIIYPLQDETQLGIPTGASVPPPTAVFAVSDPRPLVRTETTESPLLVAGSGAGLVNASAAGLLDGSPTILYDASYAHDEARFEKAMKAGAVLVLTDTNQRQQDDFGSTNNNTGYVEQAHVGPLGQEPHEVSFGAFPTAGSAFQTVTTLSSVKSVQASDYGNPITNTPEDQAYNAFDQNPDTRWAEGSFGPATGAKLRVTLTKPVTASEIRLLQPQTGPRNRFITKVTLTFNERRPITVKLTKTSRIEPGQVVHFPTRSFTSLTITVDATSSGIRKEYNGLSGVGFADVTIPGVAPVVQTLRLPSSLMTEAGPSSIAHPLVILMNRIRAAAVPPRSDPELDMSRSFTLPTARTFSVGGTLRISAKDPDPVIDQLVGRTPVASPAQSVFGTKVTEIVFANSSGRLPGDVAAGAYSAVDDNPTTSWTPGFGEQDGNWLQYSFDKPLTFDNLNLQLVTDGRHSIPTQLTITTDRGAKEVVNLPHVASGKGRPQGSTTTVPLSFPPITGQTVRITIDKTRLLHELDYYSNGHQIFPVGIAELGFPGVVAPATPAAIPAQCFSNLLTVDGTPIDIRVSGTSATALSSGALQISGCGNSANGITLSAGNHVVQTAPYQAAGLDVDALWLSSETGGGALPLTAAGTIPYPTPPTAATPTVHVVSQGRYELKVKVTGNGSPYWLVLGQSQSNGWKASTQSGHALGSSSLIDGYANGWLVSGSAATGTQLFTLVWAPQHIVNLALAASAAGLAVSIALVAVPPPLLAAGWESTRRLRRLPRRLWRRRSRSAESEPEVVPATPVGSTEGDEAGVAVVGFARRLWRRSRPTIGSQSDVVPTARDRSTEGDEPDVAVVGFPRRLWRRSRPAISAEPDVAPTTSDRSTEGDDAEDVSVVGFARRLWRRIRSAESEPQVVPAMPVGSTEGDEAGVAVLARDDPARNQPVLSSLLTTRGRRPHWLAIVIAALLTAGLAGAVTAWIAAPIIAVAIVVGCLIPWSRLLFVLAPVGLLAATGYYMVYEQLKYRYVSVIGWPASFPAANTLTWMAVVALLAAAVVEVARWRPWSLQPDPVKAPEPSPLPLPLLPDLPPMAPRRAELSTDSDGDLESPDPSATPGSDGSPPAESDTAPEDDPTDETDEVGDRPAGEAIDVTTDEENTTEKEPTEPETTEPETQPSNEGGDNDDTPTIAEADEPPISD